MFDLLVFLLSNRDRVLSKDDLLSSIWGGRIVSESTLASRINAVRRAIGDNGKEQRLVRTIIGKGIRFVGSARERPSSGEPIAAPENLSKRNVEEIVRAGGSDAADREDATAIPLAIVQTQPGWPRRIASRPVMLFASLMAIIGIPLTAWWAWPDAGTASVQAQEGRQSAPAPVTSKPAPRLSIVVLPFANLSNDPEQEYFSDAITDDLTADLSRVRNSFVIARTTAFTYKGKPVDVKQVGQALGVRYVLEGSVRRLGESVQVNVQLIDADTGSHVWADRFDTDVTNLTKAQREITGRLARTLHLELLDAAGRQIEQEKNPLARDLAIRGWAELLRPVTATRLQDAQRDFEQVLELDPESADARIGLAWVFMRTIAVGWSKSRDDDLTRADRLLRQAIEQDDNDARAHFVMGWLRREQNHFVESRIELEKAIALDRNFAPAMLQLGWTLQALAEPEAAIPHIERGLQLDPRSRALYAYYAALGTSYLLLDRVDEAVELLRKARAADPRIFYVQAMLAAALGLKGEIDEAKVALGEFLKLKPELNSLAKLGAYWSAHYSNPKFVALAERSVDLGLRRAGLPED